MTGTALDIATRAGYTATWQNGTAMSWNDAKANAAAVLDALGIDPSAPLDLLEWHATQTERARIRTEVERLPDPASRNYMLAVIDGEAQR